MEEESDSAQSPGLDEQDGEELARQQAHYDDHSLVFRVLSGTTELLDVRPVMGVGAILSVHLKSKARMEQVPSWISLQPMSCV